MTKKYGRRTFEEIVRIEPGDPLALSEHWLLIEDAGVHLRQPTVEERSMFSPEELAEMRPRHPTGSPDAPALPFPFTLDDLIKFEKEVQVIAAMWVDLDGERVTTVARGDGGVTELLDDEPRALVEQLLDALEQAEHKRTASRKVPKQRAQEDAILAAIRSLGHDPIKMPPREPGHAGIKAQVRGITREKRPDLFAGRTFDLAWERLRADQAIKDDGEAAPSG